MKYRKKPVVIEAMQFTQETKQKVYSWASSQQMNIHASWDDSGEPCLIVPTLEGEMTCSLGDYLIQGVKGEFYPCKSDIFEMTYEKVE